MQNLEIEMTVFGQKFQELLEYCRRLEQQLKDVKEEKFQLESQYHQVQQELEQIKRSYENKVEQYIASIDAILNKGENRENYSGYLNN